MSALYERVRDWYRTGWRPFTGWGLGLVVTAGGMYEFVLRHLLGTPGNDVMAFVAYLTCVGGLVWMRGKEKKDGQA